MATKITRKYDFVPRTPAKADQVDEEFNQVVTVVNATIDDVDAIEAVDAAQDILIAANISDIATLETADAAQDILIAANTAKVTYPSADSTKLAGIEASADVTDAANVAAAGAFMKASDDTDDITEGVNKFVTAADITKLSNLSGTNTGDQAISDFVEGPASSVNENIPLFDGITGKIISDSEKKFTTTLGSPGVDTNIPTEKAVRLALVSAGGGDVSGPAVAVDNAIARMDGTTGKFIQSGPGSIDDSGNVAGVADLVASGAISGANLSGTNTGDQTLPTRDSLGLDTDDTVAFANLSGTNTGDQTLPTRDSLGLDTDDTVAFANLSGSNTGDQVASGVGITDTGAYYTGTEVETALQEIGAELLAPDETAFTTKLSVASLPAGTLDGAVSGLIAKGMTLNNLIPNGDFSSGTTGWTGFTYYNFQSAAVVGVNLVWSYTGTSGTPNAIKPVAHINNNKYFAYVKMKRTGDYTSTTFIYRDVANSQSIILRTTTNAEDEYYGIYTPLANSSVDAGLQFVAGKSTASTATTIELNGNIGVFAINMTALGIADYTEAQMLDLVQQGYFDGLTGVENPVIESVGKNLFDGFLEMGDYTTTTGVPAVSTTRMRSVNDVKVKELTTYKASNGAVLPYTVFYLDSLKAVIGSLDIVSISYLFTTPARCKFIKFRCLSIDLASKIQIEEGSTATTYEPYKSSSLSATVDLHRVPNGVADRIYEADVQIWHEQNVQEYTLLSGDIGSLTTSLTNLDYVRVTSPSDAKAYPTSSATYDQQTIVDGYPGKGYVDSLNNINTHTTESTTSNIIIFVAKGTYADLAAAQTALTGTKIYYQLATPVITNLTTAGLTSGELLSMENGTLYNSSDTFQAQDVSFNVPSNRAAQIESLFDSANTQAKQIAEKANKAQEDWIEPTLLNSWVNYSAGSDEVAGYFKDEFGIVHLKGNIKDGTTTANTALFTLPVGYRPTLTKFFPIRSYNGSADIFGAIMITSAGSVAIRAGASNTLSLDGITFKI